MSRPSGPVWVSSGLHLTRPAEGGKVAATPDLLRAWLMRVELRPIPESGPEERALHARLVDSPERNVTADDLDRIEDPDGRENYRLFLGFRDHLLKTRTIEDAYQRLFEAGAPTVPPVFIEQMVHLIVANLFETRLREGSAFHARAAELLFREQRATIEDGVLVVADAETVEQSQGAEGAALFRMIEEAGTSRRSVTLDVLSENPDIYWERASTASDGLIAVERSFSIISRGRRWRRLEVA